LLFKDQKENEKIELLNVVSTLKDEYELLEHRNQTYKRNLQEFMRAGKYDNSVAKTQHFYISTDSNESVKKTNIKKNNYIVIKNNGLNEPSSNLLSNSFDEKKVTFVVNNNSFNNNVN
jgi:hypothetical protein